MSKTRTKVTSAASELAFLWRRSDPAELKKFDPSTKDCTMNCGPHSLDPRSKTERHYQCSDCSLVTLAAESKLAAMPCAGYGVIDPDYARVFTHARIVAWQFGYACLAHGSFTRDLDLLLVPWTENACAGTAEGIVRRIADVAGLTLQGEPTAKPHGRRAWTLLFPNFNDPRWVDVSVFTPIDQAHGTAGGGNQPQIH